MDACKMCWKTKEISPVFQAYPKAVEFCKGCAFDIHRVVNALAYALDTSGFAIVLVRRGLHLFDLSQLGGDSVSLSTGELVDELKGDPGEISPSQVRERVRVFQEVAQGGVEGESQERGLEEGSVGPQKSPERPQGIDQEGLVDDSKARPRKSK